MKTRIETRSGFNMRNEDYFYIVIFVLPFLLTSTLFFMYDWGNNLAGLLVFIAVNILFLLAPILLILISHRKRKKELCWIEDDTIVKYRNHALVFKIPLSRIVSIRVQDRKGDSGSIIFFTNEASKNYWHTYTPINVSINLEVYGLTKNKINHVKNRKSLIHRILEVNPKLHFIESY